MVRKKLIQAFRESGLLAESATELTIVDADGKETKVIDMMVEFMKNNALLQVVSDVNDFCVANDQIVRNDLSTEWSNEEKSFRLGLVAEEYKELAEANEENNSIEERDATIDLFYVLGGYNLQRGTAGSLSRDWKMVHDNNMTKICQTEEIARDTVAKQKRQLVDCAYFPTNSGFFVVKRKEDGKVLKPHTYTPVKLKENISMEAV